MASVKALRQPNGAECVCCLADIDECSLGVDTCDLLLELCQNEPGSYSCVKRPDPPSSASGPSAPQPHVPDEGRCPKGFKFNSESRVCDGMNLLCRL